MPRTTRVLVLGALLAALLVAPASSPAANPKLVATVGPGFTITITKGGKKVTKLAAGKYTITVRDKSKIHNFRLKGPGKVNKATTVAEVKTKTWTVTLKKGTYTYVCDPHPESRQGTFKVT
jgi:plastocyanin